jgi:outer membrane protein TolC
MKSHIVLLILTLLCRAASAQTTLQDYQQMAIAQSDMLKQQKVSFEKATLALKEAKLLFRPNSTLSADYFLAAGGRTVDFPIGDLLNPAYSTLNQLTQSNNFPMLENQSILLNPSNFYDLKVRTTMPIINPEIKVAQQIKAQQTELQQTEIAIYTHQLTHDVKSAYYTYLKASEAVRIYQSAVTLADEGLRVNQSLFRNDKVNRTAVIRAEQEVVKYKSQVEVAEHTAANAQAYFNFLLNRNLTEKIDTLPLADMPFGAATALPDRTIANRQELLKLGQAQGINRQLVSLTEASQRPKLNAFLDLGAQEFDFKFNRQTPYLFGGLSMKWDIYTAGRSKLKVQQAALDVQALDAQTAHVRKQLNLQLQVARTDLAAAQTQYRTALSQVATSERYHQDMQRMYREGMAMYIELLDAQNQLITNRLQANVARFDVWIKVTEVERVAPF